MMSINFKDIANNYIVCGRGQRKYNSNGNKTLRNLVSTHLATYMSKVTKRSDKTKLVERVTREILGMNMVFVKWNGESGSWDHLTYGDARAKVAHRFRDAARRVYSGADPLTKLQQVQMAGDLLICLQQARRVKLASVSHLV